jgi:hypothetical protein
MRVPRRVRLPSPGLRRIEALFHRVLIAGNGLAYVAWFHWTFVRERFEA